MTPTRKKRLMLIALVLIGAGVVTALMLTAFKDNIQYFKDPSHIHNGDYPKNRNFRLGGMVVEGSVQHAQEELKVRFDLTDNAHVTTVEFAGILPDLFREGQGIIAIGQLDATGVFQADEVLAKHDENYMPPEVHEAMKNKES